MLTKLGKYEIEAEIGHGGMGTVYRAKHAMIGKLVALKIMSASLASDKDSKDRFLKEAVAGANLVHPNIVQIFDYGIDEDTQTPFIVMEFLEGNNLGKVIAARLPVHLFKKLDIVAQVCKGLHYAHQQGVVHRDVKPANVVVLNSGAVKVVDFGIARIVQAATLSKTGWWVGTVQYMAPERFGKKKADPRSDIWSAGTMLYELLAYQHPFLPVDPDEVPDPFSVAEMIKHEPPPPLTDFLPDCPPELDGIVRKALEKDPDNRYQTGDELAFDLEGLAVSIGRQALDMYLKEGEAALAESRLPAAQDALQQALEIDSRNSTARKLMSQVQAQVKARMRAHQVDQALLEALTDIEEGNFDKAIAELDEALVLEPRRETVRQYRQIAVEKRDRQQVIESHLKRVQKAMAAAQWVNAKAELEALLAVDPGHEAGLSLLNRVSRELASEERKRQAREHIRAARTDLEANLFEESLKRLERAREIDATNPEIESLVLKVRLGRQAHERQSRIDQRLGEIRGFFEARNFQEAVKAAANALQEFPGQAEFVRLHAEATARARDQERQFYVNARLEAVRGFLERKDYQGAVQLLESAIRHVPEEPRLAQLLNAAREAEEKDRRAAAQQKALQEANQFLESGLYSEALAVIAKATQAFGPMPELEKVAEIARTKEAEKRGQRERARLDATRLLQTRHYDEALNVLSAAATEVGATPELEKLARVVRERQEEQARQSQRVVREATQLIEKNAFSEALDLLAKTQGELGSIPELEQFADLVRQKQADLARGVERISREATSLMDAARFSEALSLLEKAQKELGAAPELQALAREAREKAQAQAEQQRRAQGIQDTLARAEPLLREQRFTEVIALLEKAQEELGAAPELQALARQAREKAQAEQRAQRIHDALAGAEPLLGGQRFAEAIALLEKALAQDRAREIEQLLGEARGRQREFQTRRTECLRQARSLLRQDQPDKALAILNENAALVRDSEVLKLQEQCRGRIEELERQRKPQPARAKAAAASAGASPAAMTVRPAEPVSFSATAIGGPAPVAEPVPPPAIARPLPAPAKAEAWVRPQPEKAAPARKWLLPVAAVVALLVVVLLVRVFWPSTGYLELNPTPWVDVVSVRPVNGQPLQGVSGQTPLRLALAPGEYEVELRSGGQSQPIKVEVEIKARETTKENRPLSGVRADDLVDEVLR